MKQKSFKTLLYIYKYVVQGTGSFIMMVGQFMLLDLKIYLPGHMGPEVKNSFKEVARGAQYGKLTGRH